jgi:hypothetical protein
MTEIGKGSRRVCLRLPDSRLCVKRYRDDDGVGETVKREIARFRFDRRRSTCAQEYDYIRSLAAKLPPEVFAVFPETMELRDDPVHGWHLVESLVLNGDGSVPERFSRTCRAADADTRQRLLCAFRDLAHAFEAAAVRFYDPQNVLVQWEGGPFEGAFRLRIVDFEPASRAFLPVDLLCPALRRMKLRRRVRRYLWQHVAAKYNPLPWRERAAWDAIIAEKGPGMGLSGCRAFLENKLVNDIFYEGLFNGKPCIVKCSSRAPESIENEYELASRMHAADPVHFPDVYAFSPGPMAFVVVEKIAGGRSLETEPADGFGDDLVAIVDALHGANVVHRDILPSNFLVAPDGHLRLIDFQFAVDMAVKKVDPWLARRPMYHFFVFAAGYSRGGAWWDDASFLAFLFPSLRPVLSSRIGRLRFEIKFSPVMKVRIFLAAMTMRVQRMFARKGSSRRTAIERRLGRMGYGVGHND